MTLPPTTTVSIVDGLPEAIDLAAARAASTHRFLRRAWFAAALRAYGGEARTILIGDDDAAMPIVPVGPSWLKLVSVPGCYWPMRSFPVALDARPHVGPALLRALGSKARALRIGPVYDDDPGLAALRSGAAALRWLVMPRDVAPSFLLDMVALSAEGTWPRNSTLKKNRFHEKHLAAHGALDWSFVTGADWSTEMFDELASVEKLSWIADRTDGSDAKFTREGHGAFWRMAASDPALAHMMWAAVLRIDGRLAAFSFDLNAGSLKYAIANSYDPAFAKHSPGKLLYYRNLDRAMADGITRVDWGAGDSGYKRVIGAEAGPMIRDWLFVPPGLPKLFGLLAERWWRGSGQAASITKPDASAAPSSPA